jgi:hypothetical protein
VSLIEIFDDRQRFEQSRSFAVDKRGQRHHRIDGVIRSLALRALDQVDVDDLIGCDTFEIERDANAISRKRAPERKQLHRHSPSRCLDRP